MRPKLYIVCLVAAAILTRTYAEGNEADLRVLPRGQVPNDRRLGKLKELRGCYFPFEVPKSRQQWEQRHVICNGVFWCRPDCGRCHTKLR